MTNQQSLLAKYHRAKEHTEEIKDECTINIGEATRLRAVEGNPETIEIYQTVGHIYIDNDEVIPLIDALVKLFGLTYHTKEKQND